MLIILNVNANDYHCQNDAISIITCILFGRFKPYSCINESRLIMINKTKSVLVSDIKIKGNITEKESIIIDGEVNGNINAALVETFENSNIKGNITSKNVFIGGKVKGDINADRVHIRKTADVEGAIKQKILSIEEGSVLKIRTEIKK